MNQGYAHIPLPPPPEPEKRANVGRPPGKSNMIKPVELVMDGALPTKRTRPGAVGRRGRGGRASNA